MEQRLCGHSELRLSSVGVGCWSFGGGDYWGAQDQADVDAVVHRAVDLGVNYFDTAEAYNDGRSEEALGRALRGVARNRFVIGTKVAPAHTAPEELRRHCEASLRRLGLDCVDLYMIHWPIHPHSIRHFTDDPSVTANPPRTADALQTLCELRREGKIRWIGVSNYACSTLEQALELCPEIVANELPYSLFARGIEPEVLPLCRQRGVGVIGYMTLLQGLLTDRYADLDELPPMRRRTRHFDSRRSELARHGEKGAEAEMRAALQQVRALAHDAGLTTSAAAIGWCLAAAGLACVLVGARTAAQLEANAKAAATPLPADLVRRLEAVTAALKRKLGSGIDYYEGRCRDRTVIPAPA